jgi:hypothetical protein
MQDLAYSLPPIRYPPPPRSLGIIGLEPKPNLIYGAQSVTGKILMSKNLEAVRLGVLAATQRFGCDHLRAI